MDQVTLSENVQARKTHSCGGLTGHQTTSCLHCFWLAACLCPNTPESSLLDCCTLDQGSSEHQLSEVFVNKAVLQSSVSSLLTEHS